MFAPKAAQPSLLMTNDSIQKWTKLRSCRFNDIPKKMMSAVATGIAHIALVQLVGLQITPFINSSATNVKNVEKKEQEHTNLGHR
jgi:hypothetical protein